MADIYDIDFSFQNQNLVSEGKRLPKNLALCDAITDALQDLRDLLFEDYKVGSSAAAYSNVTGYVRYDRVIWENRAVYECQVANSSSVHPTGDALSETNWRKVLDNYIGSDERRRYNAQTIVFCAAINTWFEVTGPDYIWIENYQTVGTAFNINIPNAVYTALGSTNTIRDARISTFVARFSAAAVEFTITPY